ncbi:MAG TPA: type II toxin-antitoxin system VapC family toxin [Acidimicrobiales bacterium]|nr:type II toxin-antitoxin system VapC family toxin [Acidimicrobiales bacterium]
MIVVDASAAVSALLNAGPARSTLAAEQVHAPHLVDAEVASALRRLAASGALTAEHAGEALATWQLLGVVRHPVVGVLDRVWALREVLTAYDACYVALAEALGCGLLTADARLGRGAGIGCAATVVPR